MRESGRPAGAAGRQLRRRRAGLLVLAGLLCLGTPAPAQTNPDAVVATDRLMLRRGPGTEFPALDSLRAGTRVEIEDIEGEWVRVIAPDGRRGYVHGNFLEIPGDAPPGPAGAAATPEPAAARAEEGVAPPTPRPTPTAERRRPSPTATATVLRRATPTPTRTAVRTPTPRGARADEPRGAPAAEELEALRARAARLEEELRAATEALAAARHSAAAPGPEVSAELARLAATVEALQQRLAARDGGAAAPVSQPDNHGAGEGLSGATVGAGVLGLLSGWIVGLVMGRRSERGRRNRIRF